MKQLFKDKKYWKEMGILLLFGILINIACFCMPMITHAETLTGREFPYYFDKQYSFSNSFGSTDDINQLFHTVNQTDYMLQSFYNNTDLTVSSSDVILLRLKEVSNNLGSGYLTLRFTFYVNPEVVTEVSQVAYFDQTQVQVYWDCAQDIYFKYFPASNNFTYYTKSSLETNRYYSWMLGAPSVGFGEYDGYTWVYTGNYPVYLHNANSLSTPNGSIVMAYNNISIGDFTNLPPLEDILNNISENYTPHTNSTPPTYDSNLSEGENISNAITGHSNNMNNSINNLGENVKNFFNKLYEKLTNVGNKISQNIYNGFSTLMQNIKDFFGAKLDSINDKLGQLVDHISQDEEESQQEIQTALQGTTFYQDFDEMKGLVTDSVAIWNSTSAPSEYKIPFHVERIAILNCDEVQYIDLSLFSPVFPYLRGVMWALVTYSLVYTVIDSIASYISGGDE